MNFVESGNSALLTPDTAVEATESASKTATPSKAKAFFGSMLVAMLFFPFTLCGMMTATNWVVDHVVIPKMQARVADIRNPIPGATVTDSADTATANAADSAH